MDINPYESPRADDTAAPEVFEHVAARYRRLVRDVGALWVLSAVVTAAASPQLTDEHLAWIGATAEPRWWSIPTVMLGLAGLLAVCGMLTLAPLRHAPLAGLAIATAALVPLVMGGQVASVILVVTMVQAWRLWTTTRELRRHARGEASSRRRE